MEPGFYRLSKCLSVPSNAYRDDFATRVGQNHTANFAPFSERKCAALRELHAEHEEIGIGNMLNHGLVAGI